VVNDGTKVCGTSIASSVASRMSEVQTGKYRRRSSRNRRREVRAAALSVVAAFAVVAAFISAVVFLEPLNEPAVAALTTDGETVIAHDVDLEAARDESPRTVYPFSVVPGGVYSPEEFAEALAADPAVGAHYGDVTPAALHVENVDAPREAYMSYRVGEQIYWTKRKLPLHDGERVLSDGSVTIRARCGNRLSDEPMQPTSDAEPPVKAFENEPAAPVAGAPVPALPDGSGPRLSVGAVPPLEPPLEAFSVSGPSGSVPFIGGLGAFGGGTDTLSPTSEIPSWVDELSEPPSDLLPPPTFPGGDGPDPPTGGGHQDPPTSWEPPSDYPPGGPPLGDPPIDVPHDEVPPPVVPEPTSLTLFGTGAMWMAIKRYRRDKRRGRP
jgi:hypothetical protein